MASELAIPKVAPRMPTSFQNALDVRTAFKTAHSFIWTILEAPRDVMRVAVGIVVKPQTPGFVADETQTLIWLEASHETHEVPAKGPQWFLMVVLLLFFRLSEDHASD